LRDGIKSVKLYNLKGKIEGTIVLISLEVVVCEVVPVPFQMSQNLGWAWLAQYHTLQSYHVYCFTSKPQKRLWLLKPGEPYGPSFSQPSIFFLLHTELDLKSIILRFLNFIFIVTSNCNY